MFSSRPPPPPEIITTPMPCKDFPNFRAVNTHVFYFLFYLLFLHFQKNLKSRGTPKNTIFQMRNNIKSLISYYGVGCVIILQTIKTTFSHKILPVTTVLMVRSKKNLKVKICFTLVLVYDIYSIVFEAAIY